MKEKWHNKELQDGLGNYDSPMNLEEAWEALDAKRHPKKEKRRFLWFWFFGLICLVSAGGYFLWSDLDDEIFAPETMESSLIDLKQADATKYTEKKNDQNLSKNEVEINTETIEGETINNFENKPQVNQSLTQEKTKLPIGIQDYNTLTIHEQLTTQESPESNPTVSKNKANIIPLAEVELPPSGIKNQVPVTADTQPNKKEQAAAEISNTIIDEEKEIESIEPAPNAEQKILVENEIVTDTLNTEKIPPPISRKNETSIGISASYAFLTSGSVSQDESTLDAIAGSVFYEKEFANAFYFKTGISYQQFTNEVKVDDEYSYFQTEEGLVVVNRYLSGEEENVGGVLEVEYRDTHRHKLYNRYRFISIPIMVGYKLQLGIRSNLKLETGLSTSIYTAHSGKLYRKGMIESFEDINGYKAKKFGALQALLGLQYEREIGSKNYLFVGSQMNLELNSGVELTEEEMEGTRFGLIGLIVGFRIGI